jgi:mRNA export factor
MAFFGAAATTTNTSTAAEKDVEVVDAPTDGISSLSFSSQADYLAVGSWDNSVCAETVISKSCVSNLYIQVRIYEVGANGQTQGKAMYQHQGPVLDVCWNKVRSPL